NVTVADSPRVSSATTHHCGCANRTAGWSRESSAEDLECEGHVNSPDHLEGSTGFWVAHAARNVVGAFPADFASGVILAGHDPIHATRNRLRSTEHRCGLSLCRAGALTNYTKAGATGSKN